MAQDGGLRELEQRLRDRGLFEKIQHDPTILHRFLVAAQRSPAKAVSLIEAMLSWRRETCVDELVKEFQFTERGSFLAAYPQGYHKVDKQGRPIYIQQLGRADIDLLLSVTTEQRMLHYHLQEYDKLLGVILPACNMLKGSKPRADSGAPPAVKGSCSILDMRGVGFGSLIKAKKLLTLFLAVDSAYYPETMDAVLVIGAPSWFSGALTAFRSVLSPELQSRVEVIPGDFKPRLAQLIGKENLLPEYGGTSSGRLQDDEGPWRDPELLIAAGLLPGDGAAVAPAGSVHARMAAALARRAEVALQPSVMVVAPEGADAGGVGAWQSVQGAPAPPAPHKGPLRRLGGRRRTGSTGGGRSIPEDAAAGERAGAAPPRPVRPSPFACPQQHLATLSAIHGTAAPAAPAAPSRRQEPSPQQRPPSAGGAAAAPATPAAQQGGKWDIQVEDFPPKLPALQIRERLQERMQQLPQLCDVRPPSCLARLRIGRGQPAAAAVAAPGAAGGGASGGGADGGAAHQEGHELGDELASFMSCLSKLPSGPLGSRWSGSGAFAAAASWQEGVDEALEALASCYLTPRGSFAVSPAPAPLQMRSSIGRSFRERSRSNAGRGSSTGTSAGGGGSASAGGAPANVPTEAPPALKALPSSPRSPRQRQRGWRLVPCLRPVVVEHNGHARQAFAIDRLPRRAAGHGGDIPRVEVRLPPAPGGKAGGGASSAFANAAAAKQLPTVGSEGEPGVSPARALCGLFYVAAAPARRGPLAFGAPFRKEAAATGKLPLGLGRSGTASTIASSRIGAGGAFSSAASSAAASDSGGSSAARSWRDSVGSSCCGAPPPSLAGSAVSGASGASRPGRRGAAAALSGSRVVRWWRERSRISTHGSGGSRSSTSTASGAAAAAPQQPAASTVVA